MIRQLPTVEFAGTKFIVDFRLNEFREVDAPHNRISFNILEDHPDHGVYFTYNKQTKNAATLSDLPNSIQLEWGDKLPDHLEIIHIPDLIALDPDGINNIKL